MYYNNALALLFWPPFLLIGGEYTRLHAAATALLTVSVRAPHLRAPHLRSTRAVRAKRRCRCAARCCLRVRTSARGVRRSLQERYTAGIVVASCAVGVGISFTGFGFRNLVTATTFTVVGVMNKAGCHTARCHAMPSDPTRAHPVARPQGCTVPPAAGQLLTACTRVRGQVLTVLLSAVFVSSAHSTPLSFLALMGCIGGGTMYRQAPPRSPGGDGRG